jgi:hypothetical protein
MRSATTRRIVVLLAFSAALLALPAATTAALNTTPTALTLAHAIVADAAIVTGAEYVAKPAAGTPVAVSSDALASFPTGGGEYGILTTGNAALAGAANTSGSTGVALGGASVRGDSDFDVTILRIDLLVPASANCLVGMDFRFLSEEYPEWVGTRYNDAFIAELDESTWSTSGSTISAPGNFAFDPSGRPITINAAGETSMTPDDASSTTYDGATPLLTAATPITPGAHSLFLSIFDQGDDVYDSAVFVDNLRFGRVADVTDDCKPGAELADEHTTYVALGDSYASGFGVEPYFPGTHKDGTENDCQRSEGAFAPWIESFVDRLTLAFHACAGAVTRDFYHARAGGAWGEQPQLDHLIPEETGLVTFTIGGNDAQFRERLEDCIVGDFGLQLLPFVTCHDDPDVFEPVAAAFARLDGLADAPDEIVPYDTLLKDIRGRTPFAARVHVGYPPFFRAEGGDRIFFPGARCEGVKKADQRWVVELVAEMNGIIRRNALRNGFVFVDPTSEFLGHELCGEDEDWFYGLLSSGRYHPDGVGQIAIAGAVIDGLAASGDLPTLVVGPGATSVYRFTAAGGLELLSVIIEWPGSDVELSLTSPSGRTYTRSAPGAGVYHAHGPTWEHFEIPDPEPGEWTASLFGADVPAAGEETTVHVFQQEPPNQRPVGDVELRRQSETLVLDGGGSDDPDGTVVGWDWYVTTAEDDLVLQGETVMLPAGSEPRSITLVVTDDDGLTDFVTVAMAPLDVKPESAVNPVNVEATGRLPVALISGAVLDATEIDASTLRLGPGGARVAPPHVHEEDVNGDGRADLLLQFPNPAIGLAAGATTLCLDGVLPDGTPFTACDAVRAQ